MPGFTITLRFFASVREQLGCAGEVVILPPDVCTVGQVREWLISRGGLWAEAFSPERYLCAARQLALCSPEEKINENDELAFFPPVTGG